MRARGRRDELRGARDELRGICVIIVDFFGELFSSMIDLLRGLFKGLLFELEANIASFLCFYTQLALWVSTASDMKMLFLG